MEIYSPKEKMDKGPYILYSIDFSKREIELVSSNALWVKYRFHYSCLYITDSLIGIFWEGNNKYFTLGLRPSLTQPIENITLYHIL